MSTAFTRTRGYQQPYFDVGHYQFHIEGVSINGAGDPAINMQCIASFDGRRVGVYYFRNFHLLAATTPKSRALWERKLDMLLDALGIKNLTDLGELVGRTVTVEFTKAGLEPLPNFLKPQAEHPTLFTSPLDATQPIAA